MSQELELNSEQRQALRAVLETFENCGMEKLDGAELAAFGSHLLFCLIDSERFGFEKGWREAVTYCEDWQNAVIESQKLRRAHA